MKNLALFGGLPAVDNLTFRKWPFYTTSVEEIILDRVRSGDVEAFKIDPLICKLEEEFAEQCSPQTKTVFCGSGTAALFAAYFALGLDYGAEVLVPTNTFRATVTPLLLLNLRPVLCDSDPMTGSICLSDAASRITEKTQALVVTHLWGYPADMEGATKLAEAHGLALVEDCSHAHGACWHDQHVGTFGDVAAFSLGTKKMISGGTGGMLVTRRRDVYERAVAFGQPKHRALEQVRDPVLREYLSTGFGANLRGTPFAAALALDHLERLSHTISVKSSNLAQLSKIVANGLGAMEPPEWDRNEATGTWYVFNCRWRGTGVTRDLLLQIMKAEGMLVERPAAPLHNQRLFADTSALTSYQFGNMPLCRPDEYPKTDLLLGSMVTFSTREFYEPAPLVLGAYQRAIEKISEQLDGFCASDAPSMLPLPTVRRK